MSGAAPRAAALAVLKGVRSGLMFDEALAAGLPLATPRDRPLAHELAAGVLRHRRRLDHALAPLVTAPWGRIKPDVQDLLRLGAWQCLALDRVPDYAAVSGTVEATKQAAGPKAAGLVNAVLRRLIREGAPTFTPGAPAGLVYSHPDWLVERWTARWGPDAARALLEHNNRPPAVHLRPAGWSADRLRDALTAADIESADTPWGLTVRGVRVPDLPGYDEGAFIVQDPAQAEVVAFAAIPDGALVWDACAAPGGKAVALAPARMVIAGDRPARLPRLVETVARAAPTVAVLAADAAQPPFLPARFDAVVLDAPCSATGTMARHPDARWRLQEQDIRRLARQQAILLAAVAPTVRAGGLLVYITCSLEPEENEMQVDAFLATNPAFRRTAGDLVLSPVATGTDGAYAARLERRA